MSSKHLQTGDPKPEFDKTKKFRIYSMRYCPFAQRARIVAAAKGLENYDIVNIKLRDDLPEWYLAINPARSVPSVEFPDGRTVNESLVVADLLDELYPEKQLQPKDPIEKAKQRVFVEKYGKTFIPPYYKHLRERTEETKADLAKSICEVEKYLADKKEKYFGGNQAGMLDFMVWPWFERLPTIYSLSADAYPCLANWFNLMQNEPGIKETAFSKEKHLKFYEGYLTGKLEYELE
ncbi:glutathione S-transferase omega-1-like [Dendronephthya gigantea]|uniref:glutathione S-transferase omega-1-like n=1 Tax=Dendronephthya gigantea TaxID=151771 RepID=UPI00106B0A03|nr:glutathione S-transferase omega-1-like [Dendronephthya gigantea]XP_028415033.1 glutathione S-transferase omega-1-like [Dendronephthya gigantea]